MTDPEWRIIRWKVWISETTGIHLLEILVVGLDMAGTEISYEKKIRAVVRTHCCAFVNRAARTIVHGFERLSITKVRIPTGDCSIFADEDHFRRQCVGAICSFQQAAMV